MLKPRCQIRSFCPVAWQDRQTLTRTLMLKLINLLKPPISPAQVHLLQSCHFWSTTLRQDPGGFSTLLIHQAEDEAFRVTCLPPSRQIRTFSLKLYVHYGKDSFVREGSIWTIECCMTLPGPPQASIKLRCPISVEGTRECLFPYLSTEGRYQVLCALNTGLAQGSQCQDTQLSYFSCLPWAGPGGSSLQPIWS